MRKVLVVDDEPNFQTFIKIILKDNFDVICCCSGEEALKVLKSEKPDVIALDVMMPGLDGFSVMRELKKDECTKNIPVIFLSVIDKAKKAYELGAVDYLLKPFDRPQLLRSIERAISGQKFN